MLTLVLLAACGEDASTRIYEDEGLACVEEDTDVGSGARVVVAVAGCESYCAHVKKLGCSVERDGMTLTVSSTAIVETPGGDCAGACQRVVTRCEVPGNELDPGEYVLIHGDSARTVSLPGDDPCEEWDGPRNDDGTIAGDP